MFSDEPAGIGLVAPDRIAQAGHGFLDCVGQNRGTTGAIAIADHDVRPPRFLARHADRRHRVAVDDDNGAEGAMGLVDQPAKGAVVRLVELLDPGQRVVDGDAFIVDFLTVADHARDGA